MNRTQIVVIGLPLIIAALSLCALPGCSGSQSILVLSPIDARLQSKAYVIERTTSTVVGYDVVPIFFYGGASVAMTDGERRKEEAIGQTAVHIAKALEQGGFHAMVGDGQSIPEDVNIVVTYNDAWQWDFKMYLKKLTITFYDRHTQKQLAQGVYVAAGGGVHDYPSSEREAPNIINSILAGDNKS